LRLGISGGRTKPSGLRCRWGTTLVLSVGIVLSFSGLAWRLALAISFIFFLSSGSGFGFFTLVVSITSKTVTAELLKKLCGTKTPPAGLSMFFANDKPVLNIKTKTICTRRFIMKKEKDLKLFKLINKKIASQVNAMLN
jgi:hypothetical protein